MPIVTTRRRLLASAVTVASTLAGCGLFDRDETASVVRTYDADATDALAIETGTGDLAVRRHAGQEVRVHGRKRAASEDAVEALGLAGRREAGRLALETEREGRDGPLDWRRTPKLDLQVEVPEGVAVDRAVTDAGDLEVEGVAGPLEARSGAGDVYVAEIDGAVDVRTESGAAIARDVAGPIAARSESGDVTVDGVIDSLRAQTGSITATIRGLSDDPWIGGAAADVSLAVARSLDVTVAADVSDVDLQGDGLRAVSAAASSIEVVVGDGGERLRIETETGEVSITTV